MREGENKGICQATTAAGTRCTRACAKPLRYCWQHLEGSVDVRHQHDKSAEMTEEDLQEKVITPWIESLGFSPGEIERQHSFSLKFGRGTQTTSRSDVLVTRDGKPLFVVEAKAPRVDLDDDSLAQALSYARLVHPTMAPLAIVTNGAKTVVVNTFTGRLLEPKPKNLDKDWLVEEAQGATPSTDDISLQYEALRALVGLSPGRLQALCAQQVAQHAEPMLRSRTDEPYLDPELFVPRAGIGRAFSAYMDSDQPLFVLVGAMGSGKSSSLYHLATQTLRTHYAVLVAADGAGSICSRIADEFSFQVSAERTFVRLMGDVTRLARREEKRFFIFVDVTEPLEAETQQTDLTNLLDAAANSAGLLKLVLATSQERWRHLAAPRGEVSRLALVLGNSGTTERELTRPSATLTPLSESELDEVFALYAKRYQVSGILQGEVEHLCRFPYFMHLVAQRYRGKRVPARFIAEDLLGAVIKSASRRAGDVDAVFDVLRVVAERLVESELSAGQPHQVPEHLVADALHGRREAIRAAERAGFVRRLREKHSAATLGFTRGWVEAYCVVFLVLRLHQVAQSGEQPLQTAIEHLGRWQTNPVLVRAVSWYAQIAGQAFRELVFGEAQQAATRHTSAWRRMLELAPVLGTGRPYVMTVLSPAHGSSVPWCSTKFSKEPGPDFEWRIAEETVTSRDSALFVAWEAGAESPVWSMGFVQTPEEFAASDACNRLDRLVAPGVDIHLLDSKVLERELAWAILRTCHRKFDLPPRSCMEGYSLDEARRGMAFLNARRHFDELFAEERGHREQHGRIVQISVQYERGDHERIDAAARRAVEQGESPLPRSRFGSPPIELLAQLLQRIEGDGLQTVTHPLDLAAILEGTRDPHADMDGVAEFEASLEQLYGAALVEYRDLVARAIPGLCHLLPERAQQHLRVDLDVYPRSWPEHQEPRYEAVYYSPAQAIDQVTAKVRPHLTRDVWANLRTLPPEEAMRWHVRSKVLIAEAFESGKKGLWLGWIPGDSASLSGLFEGGEAPNVAEARGSESMRIRFAPIRAILLRWLERDIARARVELHNHLLAAAVASQTEQITANQPG